MGTYGSARILAPLALGAAIVAVVIVVAASGGGEGGDAGEPVSPAGLTTQEPDAESGAGRATTADDRTETYTVRSGDVLESIAAAEGVTVENILALNPDLDPRTLVAGQRIRIRE